MNHRIALAAALTAAFAFMGAPHEAQACGPYGGPTPKQQARMDLFDALHRHKLAKHVSSADVNLLDSRRGVGTVRFRSGRVMRVGLLKQGQKWRVTRRLPRQARR